MRSGKRSTHSSLRCAFLAEWSVSSRWGSTDFQRQCSATGRLAAARRTRSQARHTWWVKAQWTVHFYVCRQIFILAWLSSQIFLLNETTAVWILWDEETHAVLLLSFDNRNQTENKTQKGTLTWESFLGLLEFSSAKMGSTRILKSEVHKMIMIVHYLSRQLSLHKRKKLVNFGISRILFEPCWRFINCHPAYLPNEEANVSFKIKSILVRWPYQTIDWMKASETKQLTIAKSKDFPVCQLTRNLPKDLLWLFELL